MEKGFTLIELLVLLAIIGVLTTIVWVNVSSYMKKNQGEVKDQKIEQCQNNCN